MLALSSIAAVPGGIESSRQTTSPHKAKVGGDNPFFKMLSLLGTGKPAAKTATGSDDSLGDAMTLGDGKQAAKTDKKKSNKENVVTALAQKQGLARLVTASENNKSKNAATEAASLDDGVSGLKKQKSHKDAADIDGSKIVSRTDIAASLKVPVSVSSGTVGAMNSLAGQHSAGSELRAGSRDGGKNSGKNGGIETVGTHSERGEGGKRLSVVDMRLKARAEQAMRQSSGRNGANASGSASDGSGETVKHESTIARNDSDGSAFAGRLGSRLDAPVDTSLPVVKDGAQSQPQSLAENLATRLRDGAADIVRSAQIVLRDGDSGLIRLRLEPESLGGVKIELKMTEKQISGKIVVQSDIAGEAFRSSLDALKDAFAECGFETTALEVEVRNGLASGAEGNAGDRSSGEGDGPYWSRSLKELDAAVPMVASAGRDGLVNVVV